MTSETSARRDRREGQRLAAPTGTVTFLFTDIEGSTRLLEQLRGVYAEVLAEQRRVLREKFATWRGHEIDTQGDSFFVAFARAADALRCAIDAQRGLAAADWPQDVQVRVRMAIHTGEPVIAPVGYVGMDVHRAARIAAAGHGGQILVSGTTHDLVADDLPDATTLRDLGVHKLKDIRAEVRLYQVVAEGLDSEFRPIVTTPADEPGPSPGEPPYLGLHAFERGDSGMFFGREQVVQELVGRLDRSRFLALVGASGSGKSSTVRAGVVPLLINARPPWRVITFTPTAHPLSALADALEADAPESRRLALVRDLQAGDHVGEIVSTAVAAGSESPEGRVLIVVDQLEEVFALCDDESERKAFLSAIGEIAELSKAADDANPKGPAVLVTLRADFYANLAPYGEIRSAAAASQYFLGAMSADELRRAIEEPAIRGGWQFTPGLVELLLRDVGDEPGALPLLSHALLETWRHRRGVTMTLRSYAESGEVSGAIARTAERVYEAELTEPQRRIARDVFLRLTELGDGAQDTRRRVSLTELIPADDRHAADVRTVVTALADARLVTTGEDTVEVAHEALIREWPRLAEWLRSDRDALLAQRRLTQAATEWELAGLDESLLFRGARLAQARDSTQYSGALNELERRFLSASLDLAKREQEEREAAERRELEAAQALAEEQTRRAANESRAAARLRRRAFLLTGALALAAILAGVAAVLARQADENASLAARSAQEAQDNAELAEQSAAEARENEAAAQAQSRQAQAERLGADAIQILVNGRDPELGALLSLHGLNTGYTVQADASLQRAGRQVSGNLFEHNTDVHAVAVSPDAETLFTAAGATVHVWDVETGTELRQLAIPNPEQLRDDEGYWQLELSEDGTTLMAWEYSGPAAMWQIDLQRPAEMPQIGTGCAALDAGVHALSGDGHTVLRYDYLDNQALAWRMPDCQVIGPPIDVVDMNDPALNADGTRVVASASGGSILAVWDLVSGQEVWNIPGWAGALWHPSFSRDGAIVAVGMFDGTAQTFDAVTKSPLKTFRGHSDSVEHAFVFDTDDGSRLVTTSFDGTARIWDTTSATEIKRFVMPEAVRYAAMSRNGVSIFTASEDDTVRQWNAGGEEMLFEGGDGEVTSLSFAPDGTKLASAAGETTGVFDLSTNASLWGETTTGAALVAFSPDGLKLLSVSAEGTVLLDAANPEVVQPLAAFGVAGDAGASAASFSADGSLVLASFELAGNQVALFDTASGDDRGLYNLSTAVLSSDGTLVAGFRPGRYTLYDATSPFESSLHTFALGEADGRPVDLQFNSDGTQLISGDHDNVVRVRDIESREVVLEMRGHSAPIRQVRVSADDRYVLSAGDDGGARLWSLETGELLRYFPGHDSRIVTAIAISPDGKWVAIGSADGSVVLTPTALDELEAQVCDRLRRDLTEEERAAYGIQSTEAACPSSL